MESFAQRITARRVQQGLTQREVAEKIGVPLSTYKEWEYGRRVQGEKIYVALSEVLDMNLKTLLTGEPQMDRNDLIKQVQQMIGQMKDIKTSLMSLL